jgi:hypothetical protein
MSRRREWLAGVLLLLSGCGGGVDSGGTGTGSADQTLAIGTIAGFGSIIVNGVRFDDAAARVSDDDEQAQWPADLRLGMRVELSASAITTVAGTAQATASEVRVRSAMVGPVESIDEVAGSMRVLGQHVRVSATTVVEGGLQSLSTGDVVRVHGTLDVSGGRYVATRIELWQGGIGYRLRGVIQALDLSGRTLDIGALRVDWSMVAPTDPGNALAPGREVALRLDPSPVSGMWRATALEVQAQVPITDRAEASVDGRITAFVSVTSFTVDGVPVNASAANFPDGRDGVTLGAKVEVEGRIETGVLVARKVEIEDDDGDDESFELHGPIQAIDVPARSFVVRGTTVRWSDATRFDSSAPDDLAVGREVEVRGRLAPGTTVIEATVVHVER